MWLVSKLRHKETNTKLITPDQIISDRISDRQCSQSLCRPCRAEMIEGTCPLPWVTCLQHFTHGYALFALAVLIFSVIILDLYKHQG